MDGLLDLRFFTSALFFGTLLLLEIGYRAGSRFSSSARTHGVMQLVVIRPIAGVIFVLFGVMIAFMIWSASARFDHRRELVGEEIIAIRTAYLRMDLLPPERQAAARALFREYASTRQALYRKRGDRVDAEAERLHVITLQQQIWDTTVAGARESADPAVFSLALPAVNEMFRVAVTRRVANDTHPPRMVFLMLFGLGALATLQAGYGIGTSRMRHWLYMLAYALAVTATIHVILDIEYPHGETLRADPADRYMTELIHSMQQG